MIKSWKVSYRDPRGGATRYIIITEDGWRITTVYEHTSEEARERAQLNIESVDTNILEQEDDNTWG